MYPSVDFRLHLMMRAILLGVLSHLSHHARKLKLQLLVLSITVKLVLLMLQQRFLFFHLYSLVGIILFGLVIWLCFQLQIRYLDTRSASNDEVKLFEYKLLGEVRMLGALRKHRSIVDIYGHQLSSKWVQVDGDKEYRILQSIILMEYVNGGSLKVNHLSCLRNCIFWGAFVFLPLLCSAIVMLPFFFYFVVLPFLFTSQRDSAPSQLDFAPTQQPKQGQNRFD